MENGRYTIIKERIMKRLNRGKLLLIVISFLPLSILEANPGFSRQMDMGCMACHNQTMSQLNSFGRKFAASGFTMASGEESMIDGDAIKLGLPLAVNAGILLKARYTKSIPKDDDVYEDVGSERGNLEIFKTSKLFFGGKIADNVGGFVNYEDDNFGGKVIFSYELGSGYAGVTTYMQNDFGPFSGMEFYNTGLYAPLKLFENRKGTNAAQATDVGHGPATGMQAYYADDIFYLMGGAYVPATSKHEGLDVGSDVIGIGRIAIAPTFGDWTFMVGGYAIGGTATMSDAALNNNQPEAGVSELIDIERESYGLDAQIEGNLGSVSTVLTLNAVLYNKTKLHNSTTGVDYDELHFADDLEYKAGENEAFSAELQVNPWEPFGVKVSYLHYNDKYDYRYSSSPTEKQNKWDRDDYTVGLDYSYRQNVRFAVEYTYSERDKSDVSDVKDVFVYAILGF